LAAFDTSGLALSSLVSNLPSSRSRNVTAEFSALNLPKTNESILSAADLCAEAGWREVALIDSEFAPAFLGGDMAHQRLVVRYFQREADGALVGKAWYGKGAAGPPGHAHGGSIAAVLDEAMGRAAWMQGHAVLAARLTVDFRAMLPLETVAKFEAFVDAVDGRKVHTRAVLTDAAGKVIAEGAGLFVVLRGQTDATT
jgi:acyl-coenzyme A thioesterase PaaI-like protein